MNQSRRTFIAGAAGVVALAADAIRTAPLALAQTTAETESRPIGTSPARETFIVRSEDGTTLAGEAQGDPRAAEILFIHGLRQSRLSWIKQFSDPALAGFRMVSFDLRGHGDSDKPTALTHSIRRRRSP